MTNQVELTGRLVDPADLRHSPAGVPIARALLEHESSQLEAGVERWVRFRVGLRSSGSPIAETLSELTVGELVSVAGLMLRARQRDAETDPLIISVKRLKRLTETV